MLIQKILSKGHEKNRLGKKAQIRRQSFLKMVLFFFTALSSIVYGGQQLYVVDGTDGQIRVIDTDSNQVVKIFNTGLITIAEFFPFITFTPDGKKAFVNDYVNNSICVLDIEQGTTAQISEGIGKGPLNIVITPNGKTAYVVNIGESLTSGSSVSWIDTKTYQAGQITDNIGAGSFSIAMTPDGSKAYVINKGGGISGMSWIDLASNQASTIHMNYIEIDGPPYFNPMAITSDGAYVYSGSILNGNQPCVSIIDTKTNTVTDTIDSGGFFPDVAALTPDGKKLIIAGAKNIAGNSVPAVGIINTETNELLQVITGSEGGVEFAFCIAITPDGKKAYITYPVLYSTSNPVGNRVMAFDIATTLLTTINRSDQLNPFYIAITPDSKKAYISNTWDGNGDILAIDTATDQAEVLSSDVAGPLPMCVFMAPSPLPPISVIGYQKKDQFLTQTDLINVIQWNPPSKQGSLPVRYAVYRDAKLSKLAGVVSTATTSNTVEFKEHNCKPYTTYTYYVVSIYENGSISPPIEVIISPAGGNKDGPLKA